MKNVFNIIVSALGVLAQDTPTYDELYEKSKFHVEVINQGEKCDFNPQNDKLNYCGIYSAFNSTHMDHGHFYQSQVMIEWDNQKLKRSDHVEIIIKAEVDSYDQASLTDKLPLYDSFYKTKNEGANITFYP